jgi:hypothetical protein
VASNRSGDVPPLGARLPCLAKIFSARSVGLLDYSVSPKILYLRGFTIPRRHNVQAAHGGRICDVCSRRCDGSEVRCHFKRQRCGFDGEWQRSNAAVALEEERQRSDAAFSLEEEWKRSDASIALEVT